MEKTKEKRKKTTDTEEERSSAVLNSGEEGARGRLSERETEGETLLRALVPTHTHSHRLCNGAILFSRRPASLVESALVRDGGGRHVARVYRRMWSGGARASPRPRDVIVMATPRTVRDVEPRWLVAPDSAAVPGRDWSVRSMRYTMYGGIHTVKLVKRRNVICQCHCQKKKAQRIML